VYVKKPPHSILKNQQDIMRPTTEIIPLLYTEYCRPVVTKKKSQENQKILVTHTQGHLLIEKKKIIWINIYETTFMKHEVYRALGWIRNFVKVSHREFSYPP
jgi:hypothetical protein